MRIRPITAARIASRRVELGMSQEELAEVIRVHPTQISKWERGLIDPNGASIVKLARALNCRTDWLHGMDIVEPEIAS